MQNNYNPILDTDSYKFSHYAQYPEGTTEMFSYIEARGTTIPGVNKVQFFGLQGYINDYLMKPFTKDNLDEAEEIVSQHGDPFNRKGWEYILNKWGGYAPIEVKAIREGTNLPIGLPLVTVKSLDPEVFWAVGHYEAQLLRAAWYGTTVATISKAIKKVILDGLSISSDDPSSQIDFKLHDFGARGASSYETSSIAGAAHLTNFLGSDTFAANKYLKKHYAAENASFSIPASEHSTITSWGKDREVDAYRNMIRNFGGEGKMFAVVSDSYNIYNAVDNIWGGELKEEVINSGATLVIRPDSGKPVDVVMYCLRSLEKTFGAKINSRGYKVLNNVRVIQGDGVNYYSIREIIQTMLDAKFSIDNIAFGMGGALHQKLDRDTFKFAMKCSNITVDGRDRDVFKDPITDSGKSSKKGKISTYYNDRIGFYCDRQEFAPKEEEVLNLVYSGDSLINECRQQTLSDIRKISNLY